MLHPLSRFWAVQCLGIILGILLYGYSLGPEAVLKNQFAAAFRPPALNSDKLVYSQLTSLIKLLTPSRETVRSGWELVWSEEFEGSKLEPSKWTVQVGADCWGNNEMQYYTANPENCLIKDGKLKLIARNQAYQNKQYTSARITTKEKVLFQYGKLELNAKMPSGKGLLPAVWLLPATDNYGDRRKNGEIDILEVLGEDPRLVYGVVHYQTPERRKSYRKYFADNPDFAEVFHRYTLEWTPEQLTWSVDDHPYFTFKNKQHFSPGYRPYNHSFFLILNLAVGGNWPGFETDQQAFPAVMEVDYIRYYQKS